MDFNAEGRRLFAEGLATRRYNHMDQIFCDPATNGCIYVGDHTAAQSRQMLEEKGVTHVVNCTDDLPDFHIESSRFRYLRFDAAGWTHFVDGSHASMMRFVKPLFDFVDAALAAGGSVLVHCLAGAHRAGTTGCLLLMRMHAESPTEATMRAKALRNVINPCGSPLSRRVFPHQLSGHAAREASAYAQQDLAPQLSSGPRPRACAPLATPNHSRPPPSPRAAGSAISPSSSRATTPRTRSTCATRATCSTARRCSSPPKPRPRERRRSRLPTSSRAARRGRRRVAAKRCGPCMQGT